MAEIVRRRGLFPRLGIHPFNAITGIGGIRLNVTDALPRQESRPGGVIAPERPTTTPTLPRPDRQPPAPEPKPTKPKHTVRNIALAGSGGLAIAGLGAYAAYETIPAVHEAVGSFLNSFTDNRLVPRAETNTVKPIAEAFDNKAREGEIKTIKRIPEEEVARLDSFAKTDDHNTIQAIHPIDVSTSKKPDSKLKFKKGNASSGSDKDRTEREKQDYLNIFYFEDVPAESTILAPVDGQLTLFYSYPKKLRDLYPDLVNNDYNIRTAAIDFESEEGKKFRMLIGGGKSGGGMNPKPEDFVGLRSLTDAPTIKGEMSPSEVLEITKRRSIPVKKGQPIMQLPDKEFNIGFEIRSQDFDPSKGKEEIINGEKMLIVQEYPTNVELFLSEDGEIVQPLRNNIPR